MPKTEEAVTFRDLYTLVDERMGKFDSSMIRLEKKFDDLQTGLIYELQRDVATLKGEARIVPILLSIAIGAFSFLVNHVFK